MAGLCSRMLVATDFSEPADAALAYASSLAGPLGATIHLVHVLEDPLIPAAIGVDGFTPLSVEVTAEIRQRAEQELTARRGGVVASTEVLTSTLAAKAIVDLARERGTDLLVVGTHGRTGLAHLLLGSVAERIVRTAECPVLTVRRA